MNKFYLKGICLLLAVWGNTSMKAQHSNQQIPHIHDTHCATMEIDAMSRQNNPDRGTLEDFERWLGPLVDAYKQHATAGYRAPILTIPVIFHIITDGAGIDNVSAALIQAQIDQLNIDFRNLAGSTHSAAADVEIEFCLATLDPSDNVLAEPGINRVTTYGNGPFTTNTIDNTIKPATQWNPNDYMNIWSANLSGGLLGWAQFPDNSGLGGLNANGGAANTDGVVVGAGTIGSVANPGPSAPYNLGRTLTHEVGHWVGLRHIWGDGGCGVDDFCNDTPESDASNGGCPNHTSCGTVDMVENYMDYTNDACMDIFTADQKARVRTVMTVSPRRMSLPNSTKCGGLTPTIGFVSGGGTIINEATDCSYQDVVLDLSITSAPSANATVTFSTSGTATGGGLDFDILTPSVVFPAGATPTRQMTVRVYNDGIVEGTEGILVAFNVTTSGDAMAATGDLADHDITINDDDVAPNSGGLVTLLSQDFEAGIAPFTTQGNAGSDRFQRGATAAANSAWWNVNASNTTQFAYTNDDDCNCNKANDRLTSPVFSLAGAYTTATLTFDHAFSNVTGETGEVQISTGGAYTTIATLTNTSTAPPAVVETPWVNGVTVNLTPYIGQANVQIRFRYSDGGNWLYGMAIDNVVITADAPANIQTTDNTASPKDIPVKGMETVHFYDVATGDVMGTIQNLSNWNYQCTRVEVDRDATAAGGPTAAFWDAVPANALAAKTFFVAPNNNNLSGAYTITLYYTEAEIAAWEAATGKNRSVLKIVKVSNTPISTVNGVNYASYNIEQQPATIGAFGADVTLTATFNSGFSGFGIGDPGANPVVILPMDLLSFSAEKVARNIHLNWLTENELNVHHYQLEKSRDAISFELINQQQAKGNQQTGRNQYSHIDQNPAVGMNYYRLGQVDANGDMTYSRIVAVEIEEELKPVLTFSPNPVIEQMTIDYETPEKGAISLEIFNVVGQPILQEANLPIESGKNNILLNVKDYPSGVYILQIKQGSHASIKRFVKK